MAITLEIATFHLVGMRLPKPSHRVEVGQLPPDRRCPTPIVVTLFDKSPEGEWRSVTNYCYPQSGALIAVEDARRLVDGYRAAGEYVEDNFDQVEIGFPQARDEVQEEVCRGHRG